MSREDFEASTHMCSGTAVFAVPEFDQSRWAFVATDWPTGTCLCSFNNLHFATHADYEVNMAIYITCDLSPHLDPWRSHVWFTAIYSFHCLEPATVCGAWSFPMLFRYLYAPSIA